MRGELRWLLTSMRYFLSEGVVGSLLAVTSSSHDTESWP